MARGGLGLGTACTTGAAKTPATVEKPMGGAAGALAAITANRAATKATNSGWAMAAQLVKKQLVYAGQVGGRIIWDMHRLPDVKHEADVLLLPGVKRACGKGEAMETPLCPC